MDLISVFMMFHYDRDIGNAIWYVLYIVACLLVMYESEAWERTRSVKTFWAKR